MFTYFLTFYEQEFLRREYSNENIDFWSACERYRYLTSVAERRLAANEVIERHISSEASDPVNIDSVTCQSIHENLDLAETGLFAKSQLHIYNLMRFDSFIRFQKSDLYKESLMAELDGQPLPMETASHQNSISGQSHKYC